jgi:uncharacterized protein with HEPN domain
LGGDKPSTGRKRYVVIVDLYRNSCHVGHPVPMRDSTCRNERLPVRCCVNIRISGSRGTRQFTFGQKCSKGREPSRSLSFDPPSERWFSDIGDAIALIEEFTSGMDFEAVRSNTMAVAAVECKLQIVSEAAIRLGNEAEQRIPDQPWRAIRGIGNHLRHAYDRIDLETRAVLDHTTPSWGSPPSLRT